MRKLTPALIGLALAFCVSGCGEPASAPPAPNTEVKTREKTEVKVEDDGTKKTKVEKTTEEKAK